MLIKKTFISKKFLKFDIHCYLYFTHCKDKNKSVKLISWFFLRSSKSRLSFLGVQQYSFEEEFFFHTLGQVIKHGSLCGKIHSLGLLTLITSEPSNTHTYIQISRSHTHTQSTYRVIIIPPYAHVTYVSHHTPEPHEHGVYVYIIHMCGWKRVFHLLEFNTVVSLKPWQTHSFLVDQN